MSAPAVNVPKNTRVLKREHLTKGKTFTLTAGSVITLDTRGNPAIGPVSGFDLTKSWWCPCYSKTHVDVIYCESDNSLLHQNEELQEKLENLEREAAAEKAAKDKDVAALKAANTTLANTTKELNGTIAAQKADIERLEREHAIKLQDTNAKHQTDLLEAQKLGDVKVNALKAEQEAELKALNEGYQVNLKLKGDELAKTQTALLTAQKNMSELDAKTKKLATDLEQAKIALNALVAEKEKIVERDSAQFKALETQITQQTEKITTLEKEAADFEVVKASLMNAKQDIRKAEIAMDAGKDKTVIKEEIREETTVTKKDLRGPN